MGFKKLKAQLAKSGAKNPAGAAAAIARKKYGKKEVQEHAAKGTSMEHAKHKKHFG